MNDEMKILTSTIQKYLENNPLVILGSGGTIPYGLPSMSEIAEELCRKPSIDETYEKLCSKLSNGLDLESAINDVNLSEKASLFLRESVWNYINTKDLIYLKNIEPNNSITKLINKLFQSSLNKCTIITTNYDRLIEYSADIANATSITNFEGTLIRKFESIDKHIKNKRIRARNKLVEIWKVHGSLDWFEAQNEVFISYPLSREIPDNHIPLIIPPGKEKLTTTHKEPYRTIITNADNSISNATCYLCIGYGFNDEHIQPKIISGIRENKKPIVILSKAMSDNCRSLIVDSLITKYVIIEQFDENNSLISMPKKEPFTVEGRYWSLNDFLNIW